MSPIATGLSRQTQAGPEYGLALDTASFVPYYEQIAEQIRRLIKEGNLKPGQVFCSEGALAGMLQISKMPVRQAFQKLRAEGLLITKKGREAVIGTGPLAWNFQELHGFSEEMRRRGLVPSTRLLSLAVRQPDRETALALKIAPSERTIQLTRLRFIDQEPVAVDTSHLPERLFPDFEKQDTEGHSLYWIFEQSISESFCGRSKRLGL